MEYSTLPIPDHFDPSKVGEVWKVDYEKTSASALLWTKRHDIKPSSQDDVRICLLLIDIQNTFCIPGFELFVGGWSGTGAVDDNTRLCEFIYSNLHSITRAFATFDTHQAMQIFHSIFFVDAEGNHPSPFTLITSDDIASGRWQLNHQIAAQFPHAKDYIERHLAYYTRELESKGKYELTIWPYHAILGGIGHALVSSVEQALFFHTLARYAQPYIHVKGDHPLTEHYSVLEPEVSRGPDNDELELREQNLFHHHNASRGIYKELIGHDIIIVAGQAKSHCVEWTLADLLSKINTDNPALANKIYILEDCTSAVVVPGALDYTEQADEAFKNFERAGMHIVTSREPIQSWPGIKS